MPAKPIVSGEVVDPLLASVIDPVEVVAEVGVNTTLKLRLLPGAMVLDVERPETVKSEPITLTCDKPKVELPPFVTVTVCELLLPTPMLPKLILVGLTAICALTPVPLSGIVVEGLPALLAMEILPVKDGYSCCCSSP